MSFVAILVTITVPQVPHEIAIRETGGCKEMWQMNGLPMSHSPRQCHRPPLPLLLLLQDEIPNILPQFVANTVSNNFVLKTKNEQTWKCHDGNWSANLISLWIWIQQMPPMRKWKIIRSSKSCSFKLHYYCVTWYFCTKFSHKNVTVP